MKQMRHYVQARFVVKVRNYRGVSYRCPTILHDKCRVVIVLALQEKDKGGGQHNDYRAVHNKPRENRTFNPR
jgi:hypothetical protein